MRTHPHAEALCELVPLEVGGVGVKVSIPDTNPTIVSGFKSAVTAADLIESHKNRVQAQSQ